DASAKSALVDRVFTGLRGETRAVLQRVVAARWSTPDDMLAGLEELAVLAIAGSGDADQLIAELAAFQRAVSADPELEYAVGSALVAGESKGAVVERLLAGKATPQTIAILSALVARADGRRIGGLIKRASDLVADQGGRVVATVRT